MEVEYYNEKQADFQESENKNRKKKVLRVIWILPIFLIISPSILGKKRSQERNKEQKRGMERT